MKPVRKSFRADLNEKLTNDTFALDYLRDAISTNDDDDIAIALSDILIARDGCKDGFLLRLDHLVIAVKKLGKGRFEVTLHSLKHMHEVEIQRSSRYECQSSHATAYAC